MSFLKKLFGGGSSAPAESVKNEPIAYNGYDVVIAPISEGGQFRVCAEINKTFGDEVKTHRLIRADVCSSRDEAADISLRKAKQMIDEQGDRIFG